MFFGQARRLEADNRGLEEKLVATQDGVDARLAEQRVDALKSLTDERSATQEWGRKIVKERSRMLEEQREEAAEELRLAKKVAKEVLATEQAAARKTQARPSYRALP